MGREVLGGVEECGCCLRFLQRSGSVVEAGIWRKVSRKSKRGKGSKQVVGEGMYAVVETV